MNENFSAQCRNVKKSEVCNTIGQSGQSLHNTTRILGTAFESVLSVTIGEISFPTFWCATYYSAK